MIEDNITHRHNEQSSHLVESLKATENFSEEDIISEQNEEIISTNGLSSEQQENPCFSEVQISANEDSLLNDEELKVRSCFAKYEDMVKEMIRKIER